MKNKTIPVAINPRMEKRLREKYVKPSIAELSIEAEEAVKRDIIPEEFGVFVVYGAPEIDLYHPEKSITSCVRIYSIDKTKLYELVQTDEERERGSARRIFYRPYGIIEKEIQGIGNIIKSIKSAIRYRHAEARASFP